MKPCLFANGNDAIEGEIDDRENCTNKILKKPGWILNTSGEVVDHVTGKKVECVGTQVNWWN